MIRHPPRPPLFPSPTLFRSKARQWEQALPLLERGVTDQPRHANSELLPMLWAARFAVLPAAQALQRPFAQGHGAHWCYAAGVTLDDEDDLAALMGEEIGRASCRERV